MTDRPPPTEMQGEREKGRKTATRKGGRKGEEAAKNGGLQ